ncbi:MAG TPA: M20/M25/M40 family metallo-hydrolase [Candidatus Dormibacteraeota bacterium]
MGDAGEEALFELLRIPSVSALPEYAAEVQRARDWVAGRLDGLGFTVELGPGGVISAEWMGRPGARVLGLYGHYDVQPPDPLDEWETPPFEPSVRDGYVYARGATDNKGQLMACMRAVELAMANGGPPLNIRFLIEGEEEIGGRSLPEFVRANADRLPTDHICVIDGYFPARGMPSLVTALRGLLYVDIEARGPSHDLHSGIFGGVAPNPFNSLAHILSELKGRDGRVTIPGFYDRVRAPTAEEVEGWNKLAFSDEGELRSVTGARVLEGEAEFSPIERIWARPTLDVHGVQGGFQGEGQKTVIPARALGKVSMRLVPDQDPEEILASLRRYVADLATPGVETSVEPVSYTKPVEFGTDTPATAAAKRAFADAFGAEPVLAREGGSVPVTVELQEALGAQMIVSGFGLPDDRLHSPNERMSLDQFHRGTQFTSRLMEILGGG